MGKKLRIITVAGARPNFMKIAPLHRAFDRQSQRISYKLIHTGQHYDRNMSSQFFSDLSIRRPDYNLGIGSGGHGEQTGRIMIGIERILKKEKPDLIVVVGDVNSTMAAAIAAAKLQIPVAHVEAGCRSFDRTMPEEINRMITDSVSSLLFTIDADSKRNLLREGVSSKKIHIVGDVMIDSLRHALKGRRPSSQKKFAILTLHRPSNVDNRDTLKKIIKTAARISRQIEIIFPVHPRTMKNLKYREIKPILRSARGLKMVAPMGYNSFARLLIDAKFVLTDSGSLQQETSYCNIPCLTLRENTERPVTLTKGTNVLVGGNATEIMRQFRAVMNGTFKRARRIPLWDGRAAERITRIILRAFRLRAFR